MRILMLSDRETVGGAAVAASRLAEALSAAGHDVFRIVSQKDSGSHPWTTMQAGIKVPLARGLKDKSFGLRAAQEWSHSRIASLIRKIKPHVINIHNIHGASTRGWSLDLIEVCASRAPVVWTLHDMWSFTGGCAYSYSCTQYTEGCDALCTCPPQATRPSPPTIAAAWKRRAQLLNNENLSLRAVAPSEWLASAARGGSWPADRVHTIKYGVPTDVYRPIPRAKARQELNIPPQGLVLLAAALNVNEPRKGGEFVHRATTRLANEPDLTVVTVGRQPLTSFERHPHVRHVGLLNSDALMSCALNAADLLLHPSLADNLPNVLLEAMACGTPSLGFDVGGVAEIIRPNETGWLVDKEQRFDVVLDGAVAQLRDGTDLREKCRSRAVKEYSPLVQAQRYSDLFATCATTGAQ